MVGKRYRLTESLRAVFVAGEQKGVIAQLPQGATLTVIGEASMPGLIKISWEGTQYTLFREDLVKRATKT